MDWPVIKKSLATDQNRHGLTNYDDVKRSFRWEDVEQAYCTQPGRLDVNIAYEAVDRHVAAGHGDAIALRSIAKSRAKKDYSYRDLASLSSRFANALRSLGVGRGDVVFTLLGRVPELYISALGIWKSHAVLSPMFSAFGPAPIQSRMTIAEPSVLITTSKLYERKISPIHDALPFLKHVILIDGGSGGHDFATLLEAQSDTFEIGPTDPEELAILHFTSGTTGRPKGAMHVHRAVVAHNVTARFALDLHPDDTFWCTADPGWVTGTSYGIIGPLTVGCTMIADEEDFDADRWYRTLSDERVTVWYTAPTAIRMLMKAGAELVRGYDLSHLRFIASVGEPLNPEAVVWGQEALGLPIHDNWWQTETGGIMISNFAAMDIKPGSMGRPMPGIEAAILARRADGVDILSEPLQPGELALKSGWPSMFRGYLKEEERYRKCFAGGWYLTGDLASRDEDGFFWFVGRADDVIKSSGHLIGPFEVESILMEHPAVAEAGVIGIPDPVAGEIVKAIVALNHGYAANDELKKELLGHCRKRLGPAVAPRQIEFQNNLPKTRSGKIMRRLLKARELGLPEGDTSTLEDAG